MQLLFNDDATVTSAKCDRRSLMQSLATGTAKLDAHVLTERLSKQSLLPNKLRCLLDRIANRRFSGKPCGSCRVICPLSHARLRGYLLMYVNFANYAILNWLSPVSLFLHSFFSAVLSSDLTSNYLTRIVLICKCLSCNWGKSHRSFDFAVVYDLSLSER